MKARLIFLFIPLFLISSFVASAQDSLDIGSGPFKISDLSSAIDETSKAVQLAKAKIEAKGDIKEIQVQFDTLISQNGNLTSDTATENWIELNTAKLESKILKWNKFQESTKAIAKTLSEIIYQYEEYTEVLKEYNNRWVFTLKANKESASVEVINNRIISIIDQIKNESELLSKNYEFSVLLLDSLTNQSLFIGRQIKRLKGIKDDRKKNIFIRESASFSDLLKDSNDSTSFSNQISQSISQANNENGTFFYQNKLRIYFHLFLFLLVVFLFYFIRNQLSGKDLENDIALSFLSKCLKYPALLAFIIVLTFTYWYYPDRPRFLMEQILLVLIIPSVFILYHILKKDFRNAVIAISVLYLFEQIRQIVGGQELTERWVLLIESVLACGYAIFLSRPSSAIFQKSHFNLKINKFFPVIPVLLAISIYSNLSGSVMLSKVITSSIVIGATVGVVLYIFISVIEGFVEYILISNARKWIRVFNVYSSIIRRWIRLILRIWATYTWLIVFLRVLQVKESFFNWWDLILSLGWHFGEIELSVELILEFVLIIIVFSVIANITRSLLEVEFLPRFNLKKGVPMAIAIMTRYTILVLGFFMAVAAAGISLDKLGFLAGALGVGIGFGLQNVVGNFVSGLILIFERPIHIDDVIEADNIEGVVKEVGIRASKIRTWDGAEVVVPNMDLISKQVTNWTLSDTRRRREQILKLEYGTDPNKVIKIINAIFEKNEEVLKDPAPLVLFQGFKEYSLDFRLLYWLNGNLLIAGSDIALSIHNSLKKNNIELAIPRQRMIMEEDSKKMNSDKAQKNRRNPPSKSEDNPAEKP